MNYKKLFLTGFLLFCGCFVFAQNKYEREYRIRKVQFPENALAFIETKLEDARHVRFYKETDSSKISYEAKFKKDRLHYSIEFDEDGKLEDVEIRIKEIDIPRETFEKITSYLEEEFITYRIRKIQQQYPLLDNNTKKTLDDAFQNLLLPSLNYELIIAGKTEKKYNQYEVLFDAAGNFIKLRKSLPPNYDHVLY